MLDSATTLAIILGVSECPKAPSLNPLPQCANSAEDFNAYLRSVLGIPSEHILNLFDSPAHAPEQLVEIDEWLSRLIRSSNSTDMIVYYTGHGGFSRSDHSYFLAVKQTRGGVEGATSMRYADLALIIRSSASDLRKYLILDCCFAASAVIRQSDLNQTVIRKVEDELSPSGTAVLCSSSAKLVSIAPAGKRHTMFSGALLKCLQEGIHGGRQSLSLEDVGKGAQRIIREDYPADSVRPELHVPDQTKGDPAKVPLFPNPQWKGDSAIDNAPDTSAHGAADRPQHWVHWVAGLSSGILSALSSSLANHPWGASEVRSFTSFPPILPIVFFVFALLLPHRRKLSLKQFFVAIGSGYLAWAAAWNIVYWAMSLSKDLTVLVVCTGLAAFTGAFILNLASDILLFDLRPNKKAIRALAVRCLPLGIIGSALILASLLFEEPIFSFWFGLALYVPWQIYVLQMRYEANSFFLSNRKNEGSYLSELPFGLQFWKVIGASLLLALAATYFGATMTIYLKSWYLDAPVYFDVQRAETSKGEGQTSNIEITYMIAKATREPLRCKVYLADDSASSPTELPETETESVRALIFASFTTRVAHFTNVPTKMLDSLLISCRCLGDRTNHTTNWSRLEPTKWTKN